MIFWKISCGYYLESLAMTSTKLTKQAEEYPVSIGSRLLVVYIHQVYCDMELQCGGHKGGWTRVAQFDTSQGDPCPTVWTLITTPGANPRNVCRSGDFTLQSLLHTIPVSTRSVVK